MKWASMSYNDVWIDNKNLFKLINKTFILVYLGLMSIKYLNYLNIKIN